MRPGSRRHLFGFEVVENGPLDVPVLRPTVGGADAGQLVAGLLGKPYRYLYFVHAGNIGQVLAHVKVARTAPHTAATATAGAPPQGPPLEP